MSLLGIDIGTTGCKAVAFTLQGEQLARSYRNYTVISEIQGYAELDSAEIWEKVKDTIREVALKTWKDPIRALSVSSLGEAMVLVTGERKILGKSILGSDGRGTDFTVQMERKFGEFSIYKQTGNLPGTFYSMPKISWLKKHDPELYNSADYFLTWADFVCFMLGAEPVTNLSLACRTLLFDIDKCTWSQEMLDFLELDRNKFAPPVKSGLMIGYVREDLAENLYLRKDVAIISGGHDQCCAVLGSGLEGSSGSAMLGMGTFICLATVFSGLPGIESFYLTKMPVEHHVRYGSYISFIYNQSGGAMIDWFLRNFYSNGNETGIHKNSHQAMFDEVPESLNDILVIPRFGATGPPDFLNGNKGCISGLSLNHSRGDILRAMLEGINFYMLDLFEKFPVAFREIDTLIATGGGSVSEKWLRITSDVLNKVIIRNTVTEASSLGAAILAGKGSNMFTSYSGAIGAMVHKALQIEPDPSKKDFYREKFGRYKNFVS